jgi:UV DNA damage repair endonuclease
MPQPQPVEPVVQVQPETILVDRNDNADEVVRNIQQQNIGAHNNIANLVENIMAQNGLNIGLHRPNSISPLSELVLQSELSTGYKIPKFTKFAGDTSETTIEHITRYLVEAGDLANNDNLRLKFFPNSLTKNAFTWFTTLAAHSIQHWTKLERLFHEQFYMGQSKISLKELARCLS